MPSEHADARFLFYKFRLMPRREELKPAFAHLNTRETAFETPDDPRLTPPGPVPPQVLDRRVAAVVRNVLRGDMSLVGPARGPQRGRALSAMATAAAARMRPGLPTCIIAATGRDNVDFETWMKMDMQYIDNWSLALDWKILLRTIPRVLTGRGAN